MSNPTTGTRMYDFAGKIFPIARSITGDGVRKTLQLLSENIAEGTNLQLQIHEVPTGTAVFDWNVPKEWVIRQAYIEDESGNRIVDFAENNLHVLGYSTPVDEWVSLEELKEHIYTEPAQPDVIPYVTSYYKERYGYCMSENQKNSLTEGQYHMVIDSELIDGQLTYGEIVLPGKRDEEIFVSTYICHPSMANNECSGPALSAELVRYVANMTDRKYTYRFIYIPETIGSITYLATENHLSHLKEHVVAAFNLTCVGDDREYSMVASRYGKTIADDVLKNVLQTKEPFIYYDFRERGSDERQFCAPGVDLPMAVFCRSKFGEYTEYHTSADNMDFISAAGLQNSFEVMTDVFEILEMNEYYQVGVLCEPQLGKRGLYPTISKKGSYDGIFTMRDFIAYADGTNNLIDLSKILSVPCKELLPIAKQLLEAGLISYEEK